jgi:hypothetical protein
VAAVVGVGQRFTQTDNGQQQTNQGVAYAGHDKVFSPNCVMAVRLQATASGEWLAESVELTSPGIMRETWCLRPARI